MQAITASTPLKAQGGPTDTSKTEVATVIDWADLYRRKPHGNRTLFELEAMVAKRMELLAWIDQLMNSPQAKSFDAALDEIAARLPEERRSRPSETAQRQKATLLGVAEEPAGLGGSTGRRSSSRGSTAGGGGGSGEQAVVFEPDEDLISHLLCRFAFCMSERWRKWFVRTEEVLLRARLRLEIAKRPFFVADLMKRNGLPCAPLTEEELADPRLQEYLDYRRSRSEGPRDSVAKAENYFTVPLGLATRLIKTRSVLCRRGRAILFRDQVQEVFLTVFRGQMNRGLHEAYLTRLKQQNLVEESERTTVMHMLDAFLEQFIADPMDNLQEGSAGSVRAGDVQLLAQTHFPLCMRLVDSHLRREGHLKHHGRLMYGLFLKAVGLTIEDSLALFSTLMTVKGGGSVEAFAKTSYGYNVRHNYGLEGKKTSYSSASCATIMAMPPVVDKHDCHGCPFRFRDEAAFRGLLAKDQRSPQGTGYADVHPTQADIEDIVSDAKGQHYTRACYKYYMATHPNAKRDTLFRSPYEYYCTSREYESAAKGEPSAVSGAGKRTSEVTPSSVNEDVVRQRV